MRDEGAAVELEHPWVGLTVAEHVALLNTVWSVREGSGPLEPIPLELSVDAEAAVLHHLVGDEDCPDAESLSLDVTIDLRLAEGFDFVARGALLTLTTDGAYLYADFCWDSETQTASLMEESCQGFEREGTIRWWDTSEQNERPGYFQLDLVGPQWWFPAGAIHLSASGNTLDLSGSKLVRIDQAVDTEPLEAKAGDRLGEAGCESGEDDLQNFAASAADVRRNLVGEYVGCGELSGSLRFDATGKVTLLGADDEELQTLSFTVVETLGDTAHLQVGNETWYPVLSSRPVKLLIHRTNSELEALEPWVLSARAE